MVNRWRMAAVAAAVIALTTACGGGGDGGNKVASLGDGQKPANQAQQPAGGPNGDDVDKMREFAKCMRDNGVDMPDPDPNSGGMGRVTAMQDGSADMEKMNKAHEACRHLLPNGGKPKPLSPEDLDKQRKIAQCMREHGVDMPDPTPEGGGAVTLGEGTDMEAMKKASEACGMGGAVAGGMAVPAK
jgi:hypothetical protein